MALADFKKILQLARVAGVAELVDAPDLGSGVFDVQVRVLSPVLSYKRRAWSRERIVGIFRSKILTEGNEENEGCSIPSFSKLLP